MKKQWLWLFLCSVVAGFQYAEATDVAVSFTKLTGVTGGSPPPPPHTGQTFPDYR